MKLPRRKFLHLAADAAALLALSRIARAQAYPTRPVRCIVGYAPGGGTDIFVRLVGQSLPARSQPRSCMAKSTRWCRAFAQADSRKHRQ